MKASGFRNRRFQQVKEEVRVLWYWAINSHTHNTHTEMTDDRLYACGNE